MRIVTRFEFSIYFSNLVSFIVSQIAHTFLEGGIVQAMRTSTRVAEKEDAKKAPKRIQQPKRVSAESIRMKIMEHFWHRRGLYSLLFGMLFASMLIGYVSGHDQMYEKYSGSL